MNSNYIFRNIVFTKSVKYLKMRKSLLVIAFLAQSVLFAQGVIKFTDTNNTWFEATSYPNGSWEFPNFVETITNVYGYIGDTVIDGYVWEKLYKTRNEDFATGHLFVAFIREENNLVFYKRPNQPADSLYDFNFEIGDKIEYPTEFLPIVLTVEEIDSIEIGGVFHKRISFDEPVVMVSFEEVWIEGIGSVHGPVNPFDCMTFTSEMPYDKDLTCFENIPVYYWNNPDYSQCYISIILSADQPLQQSSFKIFPNPTSDFIQLELNVPGQTEGRITIFDQAGRMIRAIESYSENTVSLDISNLKPGIYFLKYISPDYAITSGFVKIQQ